VTMNVCPNILAAGFDVWGLALSIGIFASVAMLVLAIFSQGGEIRLSPQREVALSTGHTDRRTAFENAVLRPLLWLLLAAAHRLAMPRVKAWLSRQLIVAGSPHYYTAEEYLALSMFTGLLLAGAFEAFSLIVFGQFGFMLAVLGLVAGVFLNVYQLYARAARRLRQIAREVPYSLDLIALAMGAGATFSEAIKTVVEGDSPDAFSRELKTVLAEMELGATRRNAMENLARRVALDSVRSIVASVSQAEELGTPLHDVLHNEATLMRLHRSVRAENAAAVASVRILLPGLLILTSVILTVFAPVIVRAVSGGGLF